MDKKYLLFIIPIVLISIGVYGAIKSNSNDDYSSNINNSNNNNDINNKKFLNCTISEYDATFSATIETIVDMEFNDNQSLNILTMNIKYYFDNEEIYSSWKNLYESNNQDDYNISGLESSYELDDVNNTLIVIIKQEISKLPEENKNEDFPTNYTDIKDYYFNLGYICH